MSNKIERVTDIQKLLVGILEEYSGKEANIMIAGGSLCTVLASSSISKMDTEKWSIFYSDERCDQSKLNYSESTEFLNLLSIKTKVNRIDSLSKRGAEEYNDLLKKTRIDLALLGIGNNGHICSIWPNSPEMDSGEYCIKVEVDDELRDHITVTIKYLNESVNRICFILAKKNNKEKSINKPDKSIQLTRPYEVYKEITNKNSDAYLE
ncbi:6PGL1 [Enterospora canceri]|uniref:6PGL1 n=1 Tax=Enterospora canceri TaxID=1081671 RepID=A0A1Y1S6F0_9MICR|nr:6PGL1 [Enterospora canceri]